MPNESCGSMARLLRLHVYSLLLVTFNHLVSAQIDSATPSPVELTKKVTGDRPTIDRRYAIARGNWSAATISLFNTWSGLDENPGRHASFYSPDHLKLIEVVGENVAIRIAGKRFDAGIDNLTKHDA